MIRRYRTDGEREVSPFQTLQSTAEYAIEKALHCEEGSTLEVLTAMVMAPLMVESVLNHVAEQLFNSKSSTPALWKAVERLSPENKLQVICERVGFRPEFDREPFQCFKPMFRFRNQVAHGKTERIATSIEHTGTDGHSLHRRPEFMPEWERMCTPDNARKYVDAAYEIALALCEAAGVSYPITNSSSTTTLLACSSDDTEAAATE